MSGDVLDHQLVEFLQYWSTPTNTNVIDYVTIATTGDAVDFGDLTAIRIRIV